MAGDGGRLTGMNLGLLTRGSRTGGLVRAVWLGNLHCVCVMLVLGLLGFIHVYAHASRIQSGGEAFGRTPESTTSIANS